MLSFAVNPNIFSPRILRPSYLEIADREMSSDSLSGVKVFLENAEYNVTLSILYHFSILEDNLANHVFLS